TGSIPIVVETDQQEPARTGHADESGENTPDDAEPSAAGGSVEDTSEDADSPTGQGGDDAAGRETVLGELVGPDSPIAPTDDHSADGPGAPGEGTEVPDAGEGTEVPDAGEDTDAPGHDTSVPGDDTNAPGEDDDPGAPDEDDDM